MSKENVINEIHRSARINFPRRHVILKDIDDLWQADLMDMQSTSKENKDNRYILIVIDSFSKFAWAVGLKNKTKETVAEAFKSILNQGRHPKNLQTDFGKEFYNKDFKKVLQRNNINHYSTYSTIKASIVERLIRTLKNKLYKQFSLQGNYRWVDGILKKIIDQYNNTVHRTIGKQPAKVKEKNKKYVLQRYIDATRPNIKTRKKFSLEDHVRISKYKSCFEKGYTPNWSTEIFKIIRIQNTSPLTYLLQDKNGQPILGAFYAQELQRTKYPDIYLVEKVLKKRKNKVLVKWLGLPNSENSWIEDTNII